MSTLEHNDPLHLTGARLLDRYEVEAAIASGGMAVIYRGRDLRLHRPVCIKVFHRLQRSAASYRTAYEHFVQEAFALSQFLHPNTLRIFDFGYLERAGEPPFQISELLDSGTLAQRVRREGALTPAAALEILEPIAGALSEAHDRGIVHRDIKPSNILFGMAGAHRVVKLCDFGIAKVSDDDAPGRADTSCGAGPSVKLFSPAWAAPEQLDGLAVGPATDVYALGLVLAYMLLGRAVFSIGRDDDVALTRAESERTIARVLDAGNLDHDLVELIEAACRDDVARRLGSAGDLAAGLRRILTARAAASNLRTLPLPAPPTELVPRPRLAEATPAPAPMIAEGSRPDVPAIGARPALRVDLAGDAEVLVAGRRLRMIPMSTETIDLGGDGPHVRSAARFRLTRMPSSGAGVRLNLRGLNCFVARSGGRPSTALDIDADVEVHLLAPDRRALDDLRCTLGRAGDDAWLFDVGAVSVAVPDGAGIAVLDLGPGRELFLLHRGQQVAAATRRAPRRP